MSAGSRLLNVEGAKAAAVVQRSLTEERICDAGLRQAQPCEGGEACSRGWREDERVCVCACVCLGVPVCACAPGSTATLSLGLFNHPTQTKTRAHTVKRCGCRVCDGCAREVKRVKRREPALSNGSQRIVCGLCVAEVKNLKAAPPRSTTTSMHVYAHEQKTCRTNHVHTHARTHTHVHHWSAPRHGCQRLESARRQCRSARECQGVDGVECCDGCQRLVVKGHQRGQVQLAQGRVV